MNLFQFLKSVRGAIKPINALVISGGAAAVFAYTVGTVADTQAESERPVRTLSSISSGSPRQGMLRRNGQLTSINVGDSRGQFASPEERAAFEKNRALDRYMANQRALSGMDAALGRAAQFSETDGLNVGNREVTQLPASVTPATPSNTGDGVTGAVTRAGMDNPQGDSPAGGTGGNGPRLAPATVTRPSGGSVGSSGGAVAGGVAGGPGSSGGNGTGGSEGLRLSGAMPDGSNIISMRGLDKSGRAGGSAGGTSSFRHGNRGSYIKRHNKPGYGKDELTDIAKRSARAAALQNPSSNEGAQVFLAAAADNGEIVPETRAGGDDPTSEDLLPPSSGKLNAIGNHLDKEEEEQDEREERQRTLIKWLVGTIIGSLALMVTAATILNNLDSEIRWTEMSTTTMTAAAQKAKLAALRLKRAITAWTIRALAAGLNGALMYVAGKFIHDYKSSGGLGVAWAATGLAPVLLAGVIYVTIRPQDFKIFTKLGNNIWSSMKTALNPVSLLMSNMSSAVKGAMGINK